MGFHNFQKAGGEEVSTPEKDGPCRDSMSSQPYPDVTSALRAMLEDRPWCETLDARGLGLVLYFRHYLEFPPTDEEVAEALVALEREGAA